MDYLEWPSNYVARCAVTIYEAAGGSLGWHNSGTVGELHMRPLGDGMINFQLHDLLDGQMLFEHTLRKPEALTVPVQQFFVIRQDNGSFRGFGFSNKSSALEMKVRVEKAVQPYSIGSNPFCSNTEQPITESSSRNSSAAVVSYRTVPRRSSSRQLTNKDQRGQPATNTLPIQRCTLSSTGGQPKKSRRLWRVGKAVKVVSQLFVWRDNDLDIGYPTDVKHVAHIGWDGPSIDGPGWMDEVRPAPNFSAAPLCDFGDPHGPDWFIDASSAAKWSASYGSPENRGLPPTPPEEYLQQFPEGSRTSKQREQKLRQRSKAASHWPQEH
ncbi:hypothetical protein CY35_07G086200 [Sphagnum magellanicum]|uniref:Uncharacterized protein n=2 Tax=Sphagnum magellanicum TaxID=128215 RepID=A0ACB8HMM1_9BRYO|nr:hypothetical protein CY35_07G086200 [Sphagnum magellanicum]KAH9557482.1 hypothetical protein CY35_07G086200 [Sphagnum magellanicum]